MVEVIFVQKCQKRELRERERERTRNRVLSAKREEASVINQFAQITGNRYMRNRHS